jgi:putative colanic acid biosynthesis acetyltransferase WcaF
VSDISTECNRSATKYSTKEQALRVLWAPTRWLFRLSPRPCFAFRNALLRLFGAKVGSNVHIYPSTHIYFPWNLEIGDWSSIGEWTLVYNLGPVRIGQHSTISQRVHLCAGTHDYTDPSMPLMKPPITIGNSVWVCADAFVGPSVVVDDGAVVGARGVVVRNVPEWTVVAGNPAKPVKARVKPKVDQPRD